MSEEKDKDLQSDYEFARDHYYELSRSGKEAVELMMELARETDSPRAFEVLSTLMKQSAEVTEKLIDLQKKKVDIAVANKPKALEDNSGKGTTNNIFVGSTAELQRLIQNQNEKDITPDGTTD